ncbi:MAG: hypothetical protein WAY93_09645 [Atopobiaceae bacterium]|jgi:cell division protein FtsW (lipid II flippase)|nr:hypothetical protein [Atopobiaceae bacterium]
MAEHSTDNTFVDMDEQEPTGIGGWMGTLFLSWIPIVGFIMVLVWSFSSRTEESKQNWARAQLIWLLIGIAIIVVLVATGTYTTVFDYAKEHGGTFSFYSA